MSDVAAQPQSRGLSAQNADAQRATKSGRKPMLNAVTTPLTTNTIMAVITVGRMNFALPSSFPDTSRFPLPVPLAGAS